MKDWMNRLFAAIDHKDADGFVSFLTEDACFRFGNAPAICNKKDIRNAVSLFLSGIKDLRHRILGIWEQDNIVICEGEVAYTRHDGSELTFPFVDIFRMNGELIADYRIFMDISPLEPLKTQKE